VRTPTGSERLKESKSAGSAAVETGNINRSLFILVRIWRGGGVIPWLCWVCLGVFYAHTPRVGVACLMCVTWLCVFLQGKVISMLSDPKRRTGHVPYVFAAVTSTREQSTSSLGCVWVCLCLYVCGGLGTEIQS